MTTCARSSLEYSRSNSPLIKEVIIKYHLAIQKFTPLFLLYLSIKQGLVFFENKILLEKLEIQQIIHEIIMMSLGNALRTKKEQLKEYFAPLPEPDLASFRNKVSAIDDIMKPYQNRTANLLACKKSSQLARYEKKISDSMRSQCNKEIQDVKKAMQAIETEVRNRERNKHRPSNNIEEDFRREALRAILAGQERELMIRQNAAMNAQMMQGDGQLDDEDDELSPHGSLGEMQGEDDWEDNEEDDEEEPPRE